MRKLLLWLVMVAVMIAAILGGTAAFLFMPISFFFEICL